MPKGVVFCVRIGTVSASVCVMSLLSVYKRYTQCKHPMKADGGRQDHCKRKQEKQKKREREP